MASCRGCRKQSGAASRNARDLVRPDGFIGFRAAPADEATMKALDAHLASCFVPGAGWAATSGASRVPPANNV
jgi:hypothetical protein